MVGGVERGELDFYLYTFELPILANIASSTRQEVSYEDILRSFNLPDSELGAFNSKVLHAALVDAVREGMTDATDPRSFVVLLVRALGKSGAQPYDILDQTLSAESIRFTVLQKWLLLADYHLRIVFSTPVLSDTFFKPNPTLNSVRSGIPERELSRTLSISLPSSLALGSFGAKLPNISPSGILDSLFEHNRLLHYELLQNVVKVIPLPPAFAVKEGDPAVTLQFQVFVPEELWNDDIAREVRKRVITGVLTGIELPTQPGGQSGVILEFDGLDLLESHGKLTGCTKVAGICRSLTDDRGFVTLIFTPNPSKTGRFTVSTRGDLSAELNVGATYGNNLGDIRDLVGRYGSHHQPKADVSYFLSWQEDDLAIDGVLEAAGDITGSGSSFAGSGSTAVSGSAVTRFMLIPGQNLFASSKTLSPTLKRYTFEGQFFVHQQGTAEVNAFVTLSCGELTQIFYQAELAEIQTPGTVVIDVDYAKKTAAGTITFAGSTGQSLGTLLFATMLPASCGPSSVNSIPFDAESDIQPSAIYFNVTLADPAALVQAWIIKNDLTIPFGEPSIGAPVPAESDRIKATLNLSIFFLNDVAQK